MAGTRFHYWEPRLHEDDVREEIELLRNLENRDGRLLQVIFASQPEFEQLPDVPEFRRLRQRLLLFARLEPLAAAETAAYVRAPSE